MPILPEDNKPMLFARTKGEILRICLTSPFPGSTKWEPNNPIWDCNVAGKPSPKQAWQDIECLKKAIVNLFKVTHYSIREHKYFEFIKRIQDSFDTEEGIVREILARFTIAKIAPKVTALPPHAFLSILKQSGYDISTGIYCPMAGFGGIIRGAERWFKEHYLDSTGKIEAYDINPNFCQYYGWTQRDVLAQVIHTDKTVFVCPPFGLQTERWEGTPLERNDDYKTNYFEFEDWCKLIRQHVIAPQYIFVGPETKDKNKNPCGLFAKRLGIQWYPDL